MIKKIKLILLTLVFVSVICGVNVSAEVWTYYAESGESSAGSQPINATVGTPEVCWLFGGVAVSGRAATWSSRLSGP